MHYFIPLDSILHYCGSKSLYLTLPRLYFTVLQSTSLNVEILQSNWLYHDSTWIHPGSTSVYVTLLTTISLLHSTPLYTSLYNASTSTKALLDSTSL